MTEQVVTVDVIESQLWPQRDARDPLGIWGARLGVTGDATDTIKVLFQVPADKAGAYVYTCYSLLAAQLTGVVSASQCKVRLLTNWPNVDPVPGVQGYSTGRFVVVSGDADNTPPNMTPTEVGMVLPNERFLLLYDPRGNAGIMTIVELEWGNQVLANTYSFEGYGYFWDRAVMQTPGGPRHPGSS